MNQEKKQFVAETFISLLRQADKAAAPKWGKMNFQQMVEHLVLAVKNANGKRKTDQVFTPDEKLEAFQAFLKSDREFRENTKSPSFPDEPLPLHFANVDMAIDKLEKEIADLFAVYDANPSLLITNPVFGALDYEAALNLMYKHTRHHARQFGLIN